MYAIRNNDELKEVRAKLTLPNCQMGIKQLCHTARTTDKTTKISLTFRHVSVAVNGEYKHRKHTTGRR